MSDKVLCVAPHPDDETLGCGGSLLKHIVSGDEVHWLIITKISEELGYSKEEIQARDEQINRVASAFGFSGTHLANFLSTRLDTYARSSLVSSISHVIKEVRPTLLYVPFKEDIHTDHGIVFDSVAACTKSFRYPFIKRVRAYETLSETEFSILPNKVFHPNLWIDIKKFLNKKIEIMKTYESEFGNHPFPRSEKTIRALANFRGSTAGLEAAEAFISLKEIL